jgi:glc operon protein GlcG
MSKLTSVKVDAIMAAARGHAEKLGATMALCVTDPGGMLLALHRMDGSSPASSDIVHAKARGAAMSLKRTSILAAMAASNPAVARLPHLFCASGGVPIMIDGECIGAVGASGGTAEQDDAVADAGIAAIL